MNDIIQHILLIVAIVLSLRVLYTKFIKPTPSVASSEKGCKQKDCGC